MKPKPTRTPEKLQQAQDAVHSSIGKHCNIVRIQEGLKDVEQWCQGMLGPVCRLLLWAPELLLVGDANSTQGAEQRTPAGLDVGKGGLNDLTNGRHNLKRYH